MPVTRARQPSLLLNSLEDDAYSFKGIFARFAEYALKADLNKC